MRYELTVLSKVEAHPKRIKNKITEAIDEQNGIIVRMETEGVKKLAYRIEGEEYAHYFITELVVPTRERARRILETLQAERNIIRYLMTEVEAPF